VQDVTEVSVEVACVDQGYPGDQPRQDAANHGMQLEVVKLPEAKKGFVLLPRRWVVEHSFGWAARSRRLARDYERLPGVLAGWHFLAFAILMLTRLVALMVQSTLHALEGLGRKVVPCPRARKSLVTEGKKIGKDRL
jgi:transposase